MNREEAARVLSSMRDVLKNVYLVAIDEERNSAIDAAIGFLFDEDNNVPVKRPDPITGLVPCGCGGKAAYESDNMVEFKAFCTKCETHSDIADTKGRAKELWNTAMSGGMCNHEN